MNFTEILKETNEELEEKIKQWEKEKENGYIEYWASENDYLGRMEE